MKILTDAQLDWVERGVQSPSGEARFNCVFCEDTKQHLYVNITKKVFHCFKCGAKGLYVDGKTKELLDEVQSKIKNYLGDRDFEGEFTSEGELTNEGSDTKGKIVKNLPLNSTAQSNSTAIQYLTVQRNLSIREVEFNSVRICTDKFSQYYRCIIFPVLDLYDRLEYFVARNYLDPEKAKYLNAKWPKEGSLYTPWVKHIFKDKETLLVCEGVFDAIRAARIAPSVALLGKVATKEQMINILRKGYRRILIMLDADAELQAIRLRFDLIAMMPSVAPRHAHISQVKLLDKDPGDSTEQELKEAIDYAIPPSNLHDV